jgi:hypothetical protein
MENEIMKHGLIWVPIAAVALLLALAIINAQAQEADDLPRLGETTAEYRARLSKMLHDMQQRIEAMTRKYEAVTKRYDKAVSDFERDLKRERARAERARESECDRLSQRATLEWSESAARLYETQCAD